MISFFSINAYERSHTFEHFSDSAFEDTPYICCWSMEVYKYKTEIKHTKTVCVFIMHMNMYTY